MPPLLRIALMVLAFAAPPLAAGAFAQSTQHTAPTEAATLDRLFDALKAAPDAAQARTIADRIWQVWLSPADPVLAGLMGDARKAGREANLDGSMAILTEITVKYPDYAEGWNQRATLYYVLGDYEQSLADIAETLKREPRHFGALAGQALCYLEQGDADKALQAMVAALAIHPYLSERALFPQLSQPATRT